MVNHKAIFCTPGMKKSTALVPVFGALIFLLLYFLAAINYPGGSAEEPQTRGFSLLHNYWCSLLNEKAINGETNIGRPFALAAMPVLALTMVVFWWQAGEIVSKRKLLIRFSGIACAFFVGMLPTGHHDLMINLAGLFGLISLVALLMQLKKLGLMNYFYFGCLNLCLVLLNNLVYYAKQFLFLLPVLQKFSFLFFIFWVVVLSLRFHRNAGKISPSREI
jgi:hypothetical protein